MTHEQFNERVKKLFANREALISRPNRIAEGGNGVFDRYKNPVLTAEHTPIFWRYDLSFRHCLLARCVMGPEIEAAARLFEDSWITQMYNAPRATASTASSRGTSATRTST